MTLDLGTPNDTWHWLRGSDITGQTSFATATRAGIYSASALATRQTTRMRTASLAIYKAP